MPLLHRLSLAQKFLILGLLALVMVLVPTSLYFHNINAEVNVARDESRASPSVVAINKLVQVTQSHRGLSAGALSGNAAFAERRTGMRDQVRKAVAGFDAELRLLDAKPKLLSTWGDLQQRWNTLEQSVAAGQIKAAESTRLHTQLINGLLTLNEDLLSDFGLLLDPEADIYFLIRASLVDLPWLTESLGIMRAQGSGFLTQGVLPPEPRATLMGLNKRALELQGDMTRNLQRATGANAGLASQLSTPATAAGESVRTALQLADQALISATEIKHPAADYFDSTAAPLTACMRSMVWP